MAEKGGASAAISAVQTKAKLAGLWKENMGLSNANGPIQIERIERVIVEHHLKDRDGGGVPTASGEGEI
jgi:hypothetical protein